MYTSFLLNSINIGDLIQHVKHFETPHSEATNEVKKLRRPPFGINLFLGKFDTQVLTFPEVLNKERLQTLDEMLTHVEKFFDESVDSKKIDKEGNISKETLDGIKSLGLFGLQVPIEYGGLGLNITECARIAEVYAVDLSIGVTLAAHHALGLKVFLKS